MTRGVYARTRRTAECHPDKPYAGNGLCRRCYNAQWRDANRDRVNELSRASRSRNLEAARERKRLWHEANRERVAQYARQRRAANPERTRAARRRSGLASFGLTPAAYDALLSLQQGVCAICRTASDGIRLAIDHDHSCCAGNYSCGKCIRGLVCNRCNRGIGYFRDDPDLMRLAAAYVERAKRVEEEAA